MVSGRPEAAHVCCCNGASKAKLCPPVRSSSSALPAGLLRTVTLPAATVAPLHAVTKAVTFRTFSAPLVESSNSVPKLSTKPVNARESLDGLRDFLRLHGLERHASSIEVWCQEMGAAFLEEVFQNAEDVVQAVHFSEHEKERFLAASHAATLPAKASVCREAPPEAASACPLCSSEELAPSEHVSVAAQHEGWGRKWNECKYSCELCKKEIHREASVNCCRLCKVFWHRDCKAALVEDAMRAERALQMQALQAKALKGKVKKLKAAHAVVSRLQREPFIAPRKRRPGRLQCSRRPATIARTTSLPAASASPVQTIPSPLDRSTTAFTTAAEKRSAIRRAANSKIPLRAWDFRRLPTRKFRMKVRKDRPPGEVAVVSLQEAEPLPGQLDRRIRLEKQHRYRARVRSRVDSELLQRRIPTEDELKHPFTEELASEKSVADRGQSFEHVRHEFLAAHGHEIKSNLMSVFEGQVKLELAAVAPEVKKCFMDSYTSSDSSCLIPTFHGSRQDNYESICKRGLLIPGRGNELQIANGAAHGRGIYTARVEAPDLSRCFCSAPEMLVCGVVDDALPSAMSLCGNHYITAKSNVIRHVGDAVVVFDQSRVVPLFRAKGQGFARRGGFQVTRGGGGQGTSQNAWLGSWAPGQGVVNPNQPQIGQQSLVDAGKGKIYHRSSKQTAFMPPHPLDASIHEKNRKRIFEKKLRDQRRSWELQEKLSAQAA